MSNARLPNTIHSITHKPHLSRRKLYAAMLVASQFMASGQAYASPEGGEVVGGEGVIEQNGLETIITQATERLAIDWQSFDVAADERVEFIQPSSSSLAINRVLSHNGSEILGRIDSNGQVMLINPNGVIFGRDSVINVGGMIASGLSVDPTSFINGDFTLNSLEGTEGKVINYGIINAATGGSVTLVGQQVQNDGLISAKLGAVNLAAGNEAVLTFDSRGLVGVKITEAVLQNDLGVDAALINNGEINAEGGRVLLSASVSEDIFSDAVNHQGLDKTSSVAVHDDGSFTLGGGADVINTGDIVTSVESDAAGDVVILGNNITSSGNIHADTQAGTAGHIEIHSSDTTKITETAKVSAQATEQGEGGDVKILGNKVGLFDAAEVNVSGAQAGGQVLIGGDYQGKNLAVRNAARTFIAEDAAIYADALIEGDGGTVIVWADDITRFNGEIFGRGAGEGAGGFAEVSGKEFLSFNGFAELTGVGGVGTLLLDPMNITVNSFGSDVISENDAFSDNIDSDATISSTGLSSLLATTDVTLQARNNITVSNNIAVLDPINAVGSLTLDAGNSISIGANITLGSGNMKFTAGHVDCGTETCLGADGNRGFTLVAEKNLNTSGNIEIFAADDIAIEGLSSIGSDSTRPNSITLRAGDTINVAGSLSANTNSTAADPTILISSGDTSLEGVTTVAPLANPTGALTISGAVTTQGGDVELRAGTTTDNDDVVTGGAVNITGSAAFTTLGGKFTVGDENNRIGSFTSTDRNIQTHSFTKGGDVTIYAANDASLGSFSVGGVNETDQPIDGVGSLTVDSSGGDITLAGNYLFYSRRAGAESTMTLNAGKGIRLATVAIDNGGSPDICKINLDFDAVDDIKIFAANAIDSTVSGNSRIWLSGGSANLTSTNGAVNLFGSNTGNHVFNTQGGDFTVISKGFTNYTSSTNTLDISTHGALGAGDININATTGAVSIGNLFFSYDDAPNNTIQKLGSVTLKGSSITLEKEINFSRATGRKTDGQLSTGLLANEVSFLNLEATDDITINGKIYDGNNATSDAFNITLMSTGASGTIDINNDIFTAGGNFTAEANNFNNSGFELNADLADVGDNANHSNGGNISIKASNEIDLGLIVTDFNSTSGSVDGSLFVGRRTNSDNVTVKQTAAASINVKNTTTFDVGDGDITLTKSDNNFAGTLIFTSAQDVTLIDNTAVALGASNISGVFNLTSNGNVTQSGAISVTGITTITATDDAVTLNNQNNNFNTVNFVGNIASLNLVDSVGNLSVGTTGGVNTTRSNQNGGAIQIISTAAVNGLTAGNLTVGNLTADGGAAANDNQGRSGGNITLEAEGNISSAAISTQGSDGNDNNNNDDPEYNGGAGGAVVITSTNGNIELNAVNTDGGNGDADHNGSNDDANGGNAGGIEVSANQITLKGSLLARGGLLVDRGASASTNNGIGGEVILTGSVQLNNASTAIVIDTTLVPGSISGSSTKAANPNSVTITGSITGTTNYADDLTINAGNFVFSQDVGDSSTFLGDVNIDATNSFGANGMDIFAKSIDVTSAGFTSGAINSYGDDNTAGGGVTINSTANVTTGAINTTGGAATTLGLVGGNLVITGRQISLGEINTSGSNAVGNFAGGNAGTLSVVASGSSNSITLTGNITSEGGTGNITGIDQIGVFTLSNTGSLSLIHNGFLTSSININGSAGSDTLNGLNANSDWATTGTNNGTIKAQGSNAPTITFTGFENLVGGSAVDSFNFAHNIAGSINGGAGNDQFDINFASLTAQVSGGAGDDVFNINTNTTSLILNGNGDADTFNILEETGAITATLTGGNGVDVINGADRENIWDLNNGTETLNRNVDGANTGVSFSGIENVNGNEQKDTFTLALGRGGVIDAKGSNIDSVAVANNITIDLTNGGSFSLGVINAEILESLSGTGTLIVDSDLGDIINWNLAGSGNFFDENGVGTTQFLGFTTLIGGDGVDKFNVVDTHTGSLAGQGNNDEFIFTNNAKVSGLIDGGTGTDSLILSDASNNNKYSVVIAGTDTNADLTITGINTITGNNHVDSSLGVATGTNTWNITGENDGDVASVEFFDFANLTGGSGADTFDFTSVNNTGFVTGVIDGGSGEANGVVNTIKGRNTANTWEMTSATHGIVGVTTGTTPTNYIADFTNIHTLTGGSGADELIGADLVTAWSINASGAHTLTANSVTLNFSAIETMQGGTLADTFTMGAGSVAAVIDGGINTIGDDKIIGANQTNTWVFGANDTGTLNTSVAFSEIESIEGNQGVDIFDFTSNNFTGSVDAIGAGDALDNADIVKVSSNFTVDLSQPTLLLNGVANAEILQGSGAGTLTAVGATTNTWAIYDFDLVNTNFADGINDGVITSGSNSFRFLDFANLTGGSGADTFDFTSVNNTGFVTGVIDGGSGEANGVINTIKGRNTANTWEMTSATHGIVGVTTGTTPTNYIADFANIHTLIGGSGADELIGADLVTAWSINASGAHTLTANATTLNFSAIESMQGGSAVDTFTIGAGSVAAIIDGGINTSGDDKVIGANQTNTWVFGANDTGTLNTSVAFSEIESIEGNQGVDIFDFTSNNFTGSVDAIGAGDALENADIVKVSSNFTVDLSQTAWTLNNVLNAEILQGNGTNTLTTLGSTNNTWAIYDFDTATTTFADGTNDGVITSGSNSFKFLDFANLTGGSGADTFDFTSVNNSGFVTGVIDGGSGEANGVVNTIKGRNTANTWEMTSATHGIVGVTTGTTPTNYIADFTNIHTLIGGSGADELVGADLVTAWSINASGAHTLTANSVTLNFSAIETMKGGSVVDTFTIGAGSVTAVIDGGINTSGDDKIIGANQTNTWVFGANDTGTLNTSVAFSEIESIEGNQGVDIFDFTSNNFTGSVDAIGAGDALENADIVKVSSNFTVDLSQTAWTLNNVLNAEILQGNGTNTLTTLGSTNNTWAIYDFDTATTTFADGTNDGVITSGSNSFKFLDFANLTGGSGADTFDFTSVNNTGFVTGVIDGGSGEANGVINTIKGRNTANTWEMTSATHGIVGVTTGTTPTNYIADFTNIHTLIGGSGADELIGADLVTAWSINASGAHTLTANSVTLNFSAIETMQGGTLADTFTMGAGSVTAVIDGGINTIGDDKIIGANQINTWAFGTNDTGTLNTSVAFSEIESIDGNQGIDIFDFTSHNFTGSVDAIGAGDALDNADIVKVASNFSVDLSQSTLLLNGVANAEILQGSGANTLTALGATTNTWTIYDFDLVNTNFADGINDGVITSGSNSFKFLDFANLTGGSGADTFDFSSANNVGSVTGIIDGGSTGTNTIKARDTDNTWQISNLNAGNIKSTTTDSVYVASFINLQNLTGGTRADVFTFDVTGYVDGLIDAGTRVDSNDLIKDILHLEALTSNVSVELFPQTVSNSSNLHVANFEEIKASSTTTNTLLGASESNASYSWNITGAKSGTVNKTPADSGVAAPYQTITAYDGFANLTGGDQTDRFLISTNEDITGIIDGGDGEDFVDYSQRTERVDVDLNDTGSLDVLVVKNAEGIIGNKLGTLTAVNTGVNNWIIDGKNSGEVVNEGGTSLSFENFKDLIGGNGDDIFVFEANGVIAGTVDAGVGQNTFNMTGSTQNQKIHIEGGSTTATNLYGFSVIEANADTVNTLVGAQGAALWDIAAFDDISYERQGMDSIALGNFDNLVGGSGSDVFNFNSVANFTSVNGGDFAGIDTVDLSGVVNTTMLNVTLDLLSQTTALKISSVEHLFGNDNQSNTLMGANIENEWRIDGENSGTLNNTLSFDNFANLSGNAGDDIYTFIGEDANVTGLISAGTGSDRLDLTQSARDVSVRLVNQDGLITAGRINISDIDTIDAASGRENTLTASDFADNEWHVTGVDSGTLSEIGFTNFKNLVGSNKNDTFIIDVNGSLSGIIDGAGQVLQDVVDVSRAANANVAILSAATTTGSGYKRIEKFIGNNTTSTLTAVNDSGNQWILTGNNTGVLNSTIQFEMFANLVGGDLKDTFMLEVGSLSGSVYGGIGNDEFTVAAGVVSGNVVGEAGNDIFVVDIPANVNEGLSRIYGGTVGGNEVASDSLTLRGGGADLDAIHEVGKFSYESENGNYSVTFSGISTINDNVDADNLTVLGASTVDSFRLRNNNYQLNNNVLVSYTNKDALSVVGGVDDTIIIDGNVSLPNSLTLQNATVVAENDGKVTARNLNLNATTAVGTLDNKLGLSVTELSVSGARGSVYLTEDNSLNLKAFTISSANSTFDLKLNGDLTSSSPLSFAGDMTIDAGFGAIILDQQNSLSGNLTLIANGNITLTNSTAVNFNSVAAQDLIVNAAGAINGSGAIRVNGVASFTSAGSGDIDLLNSDNDFNILKATSLGNIRIKDKNSIALAGIESSKDVSVSANGDIAINACIENCAGDYGIFAANINIVSDSGVVSVGKNIQATNGAVAITAKDFLANDSIAAKNISLIGQETGFITLNAGADLTAEVDGQVVIDGGEIEQHSTINSGLDVTINSKNQLNDIVMRGTSSTTSLMGSIYYSGNNISITSLRAENGVVNVQSADSIVDVNGDALNIIANSFDAIAVNGIGNSNDAIDMDVDSIHLLNKGALLAGSPNSVINIVNEGQLTIEMLRNNGNISVGNKDGDIILGSSKSDFSLAEADATLQGGTINANSGFDENGAANGISSLLTISVNNGDFIATGNTDKANPDVIANRLSFNFGSKGSMAGQGSRPLVMHIPNVYTNNSKFSTVIWYLRKPALTDDDSIAIGGLDGLGSASDQLIKIEELNEVDQAVFSNVRNYVYDEVAILMPVDQRYDEDEEDE